MSLGNRIKQARTFRGWSHEKLGGEVGVTREAAWQWEAAKKPTKPDTANLEKIAIALRVSYEWLATGRGEMAPEFDDRGNYVGKAAGKEQVTTTDHPGGAQEGDPMTEEIDEIIQIFRRLGTDDRSAVLSHMRSLDRARAARRAAKAHPPETVAG